jgi:putative membrane protein
MAAVTGKTLGARDVRLSYRPLVLLIGAVAAAIVWSVIHPVDFWTWVFELAIGFAGVIILAATYRRFQFSNLVYTLVAIHFVILAIGAKYTYAEMPLFNWLRDTFHLSRNYYDRVGHFAQGFVPAIICRELLLRTSPLRPGKWLAFLCVAVCLALSAFYELIEWWMVIFFYKKEGAAWLGMQGDVFDAQGDMFMALCGAITAIVLLSGLHNRSITQLLRAESVRLTPGADGS